MRRLIFTLPLLGLPSVLSAQEQTGDTIASGSDTAWILTASALVLMMTLPGLGLFYGGLVRAKNFLSVLLQIGAVASVASVLWVAIGYTLAFGEVTHGFLGGLNAIMLAPEGLGAVRDGTAISESTFALFQMTFAVITPALMIGAWPDRARFGWVVGFCALWGLVVYAPVVHWVWGGGWLAQRGVLDFAGGIVVHTTAGISALVIAIMLGRRAGFPGPAMLPHAPSLTMAGAALLWVGWFGFNGGSALAASDGATSAIINTHLGAAVASLVWLTVEKFALGKPTSVGWATGAIAGLATVTPAAGFINPAGAMLLGVLAAVVCYYAIQMVKQQFKVDDSLDVFAVHGVGGMLGSIMLGALLSTDLGGSGYADGMSMGSQFAEQALGVAVVALFSGVVTYILAKLVGLVFPMRVSNDEEREGLDITSHGERAWEFD